MTNHRLRHLGIAAAGVALLAGLTACSPGMQAAPSATAAVDAAESRTIETPRLSADAALAAATAALDTCRTDGAAFVTVAVVDRFGQLQALVRGDGAAAHTIDAATKKAYTSAAFGANTSALIERLPENGGATLRDLEGTLFLAGGVPVKLGSATIAGVGVGGAPDGMVDESCAAAGAAVLAEATAS